MKITIETNGNEDIAIKIDGFDAKIFCMATNEILNSVAKRMGMSSAKTKTAFLVLMAQTLLTNEDC